MVDDSLIHYVNLLWRRAWLLVLGTLLAAGSAYAAARLTTPVYEASAKLLVNEAPTSAANDPASIVIKSERLARTYADMMQQRPVLTDAIAEVQADLSADDLARRLSVTPIRDTQLIALVVQDGDPVRAAALANAIPQVFSRQNAALQTARYADAKANLNTQLAATTELIEQVQAELAAGRSGEIDETDRQRLQAELARLQQVADRLNENLQNIQLAEAQSTSNIVVTEPADIPTEPVRPRPLRDALLAGVVGLMLAGGVIFLIDYLDTSLRASDQVENRLKLPVVGLIASVPITSTKGKDELQLTADSELVALCEPRSPVAEAFRSLRTNVQIAGVDRPIRTLLVTSAGPDEGKTLVAANLAVVMEQAGREVILLDADLRRPRVHRLFRQTDHTSLAEVLLGDCERWPCALMPTALERLMTVPAGCPPPNPSELLGARRMREFIQFLTQRGDIVIIDSPPLLPVTDALVLAPEVDGVLLVVRHGHTHLKSAQLALTQLQQAGARVLGVVLNQVPIGQRSYGYHYGYYYRSYYTDNSPDGRGGGAGGGNGSGRGHSRGHGREGSSGATTHRPDGRSVSRAPMPDRA